MIKKPFFVLLFLLLAASAFAETNLGAGLNFGYGSSKSDLEKYADATYPTYKYEDTGSGIFTIEAILESNSIINLPEQHRLGARLGFESRGVEKAEYPTGKIELNYWEVPITLYYKYMTSDSWGLFGGLGLAYGKAYSTEKSVTKFHPFITGGVEYRFTNWFGLGFDLKYNAGAEYKKDGFVYRDVNGMEGALTVRFYLMD
ncbi:MAG: porin family protein [Spirochaetia bacterium]|jgi:hypothetical protein|nr:porin family protein [Spirochaetia bacterium]